jgi:hypothetical protein
MEKWDELRKFIEGEVESAKDNCDAIIERQLKAILLRMRDLEKGLKIERCYYCELPKEKCSCP